VYATNRHSTATVDGLRLPLHLPGLQSIVALLPHAKIANLSMTAGVDPPAHTDYSDCGCPNVTESLTKEHCGEVFGKAHYSMEDKPSAAFKSHRKKTQLPPSVFRSIHNYLNKNRLRRNNVMENTRNKRVGIGQKPRGKQETRGVEASPKENVPAADEVQEQGINDPVLDTSEQAEGGSLLDENGTFLDLENHRIVASWIEHSSTLPTSQAAILSTAFSATVKQPECDRKGCDAGERCDGDDC
jgi:hypothetical protein